MPPRAARAALIGDTRASSTTGGPSRTKLAATAPHVGPRSLALETTMELNAGVNEVQRNAPRRPHHRSFEALRRSPRHAPIQYPHAMHASTTPMSAPH